MIPRGVRSRDIVGMKVKTTRTIKNGTGMIVPKGTVMKITASGKRGFNVTTEACPHCGLSAHIRGVTRDEVELVTEGDSEDKKEIVNHLEALLKKTRAGKNIAALRLNEQEKYVTILFQSGGRREINIDGDSGYAIIKDVIEMV